MSEYTGDDVAAVSTEYARCFLFGVVKTTSRNTTPGAISTWSSRGGRYELPRLLNGVIQHAVPVRTLSTTGAFLLQPLNLNSTNRVREDTVDCTAIDTPTAFLIEFRRPYFASMHFGMHHVRVWLHLML